MIFIGHYLFDSKPFYHVASIESIFVTPSGSTLFIEFKEQNLELIRHAKENRLPFAVGAHSLTEVLYASTLGAHYAVVSSNLAKSAQNIANEYLFDTKILAQIEDETMIEEMALLGIDGVICAQGIVKVSA